MKQVAIFDLDNCLADDEWRIHLIRWHEPDLNQRFHKYHIGSIHDELGNDHLLKRHSAHDIVIFTARPTIYRDLTEAWLEGNGIAWRHLLMRNQHDHRPSVELKQQQLLWLIGGEYDGIRQSDIIAAYDDRPDVIEMYRRYDIPAEVVNIHNTPYAPKHNGTARHG